MGQPHRRGDIVCARPATQFLATAMENRLERGPLSDLEDACPLGASKLVAGEAEHVDTQIADLDRL